MNKDSERDIEQYLSTAGLMHVLEISRSTVYRLMAKGMPNIMVGISWPRVGPSARRFCCLGRTLYLTR